jgi:hypothetical protein
MWSKDTLEPMVFDAEFVKQSLEAAAATARLADTPGERP